MFESIGLMGSRESGIELQTRLRSSIPNAQSSEPDSSVFRKFSILLNNHPGWVQRKSPCGFYNCAGHVWASRRTAVYEDEWWKLILEEDGYRKLLPEETSCVGDLVLYSLANTSYFLHVGVISEIRKLNNLGAPIGSGVAWILSKLNGSLGEVLHHFRDVPWKEREYEVDFWTDRPKP